MQFPVIPAPRETIHAGDMITIHERMPLLIESSELDAVSTRFAEDLSMDTGLMLTMGRDAAEGPAIRLSLEDTGFDAVAPVTGIRADGKPTDANGPADERHSIDVDSDGIRIRAVTPEGIHRALTTLRQLIAASTDFALPVGSIVDGPRFAWRGLSLDVARTFHGPDTVRRVIDMCSLYKLNVLHLHLTDDQGWRVEVPSRPALTEIGAMGAMHDRPGGFYTVSEMAELVAYAAERFITIVPEIDMPGHTAAIFRAYPELAPAHLDPTGLAAPMLDATRDETWAFVKDVLDAVIAQFPQSAFVHIGGDEAFGMADEDLAAFVERAITLVQQRGKRAIGWQEIARAKIDADTVVQFWMDATEGEVETMLTSLGDMVPPEFLPILLETFGKAPHDVPAAAAAGAKILASPTSRVYFDRPHAEKSTSPDQEEQRARVGLPVYPPASIRDGVEWDPQDDIAGLASEDQIAGVEAAVWCETVTDRDDLEFLLLPRLAGIAEKGWSTRGHTEWVAYAQRLAVQPRIWDSRGWTWFRSSEVDWRVAVDA